MESDTFKCRVNIVLPSFFVNIHINRMTPTDTHIHQWTRLPLVHIHHDVIKWKHFLHYWPFVLGIHQSLVNSMHWGQWHRALIFSLIYAWINSWVSNREAGDLRCHHAHYDVIVMCYLFGVKSLPEVIPICSGLNILINRRPTRLVINDIIG